MFHGETTSKPFLEEFQFKYIRYILLRGRDSLFDTDLETPWRQQGVMKKYETNLTCFFTLELGARHKIFLKSVQNITPIAERLQLLFIIPRSSIRIGILAGDFLSRKQ